MKKYPLGITYKNKLIAWLDFDGYYHCKKENRKKVVKIIFGYAKVFKKIIKTK